MATGSARQGKAVVTLAAVLAVSLPFAASFVSGRHGGWAAPAHAMPPGEIEHTLPFTGFDVAEEPWCRDHPGPCALFADAISTANLIPEGHTQVYALSHIAHTQAMAGLTEAARETFAHTMTVARGISDDYWRDAAFTAVVEGQAAAGFIREAETAAAAIEDQIVFADAISIIATALAEGGRTDEARSSFAAAAFVAATAPALEATRFGVWVDIARRRAVAGFAEDALEMHRQLAWTDADMARVGLDALNFRQAVEALARIGLALADAGLHQTAREAFANALAAAARVEEGFARTEAMIQIARDQVMAGFHADALAMAASVEDAEMQTRIVFAIAASQADAGHYDAALETSRMIMDPTWLNRSVLEIALDQARAGLIDETLRTVDDVADAIEADNMEMSARLASVLATVSGVEAAAGLSDSAQRRLSEAVRMAEGVDDPRFEEWALRAIAEAEVAAGLMNRARKRFIDASSTIERINDEFRAQIALSILADAQAAAGFVDLAQRSFSILVAMAQQAEPATIRAIELRHIARYQANAALTAMQTE